MKYYYDLHIHSCLSACADDDMTPNNIVNMCRLKGLNIIAVADHNSDLNARAVYEVAKKCGILVVPAIELTTAEDIHILCYFESFLQSGKLSALIGSKMVKIKNNSQIFGRQLVLDKKDKTLGEVEDVLSVSSGIRLEEVNGIVNRLGGVAVPAHIDRQYNSIIGVLGSFDYSLGFSAVESKEKTDCTLPFITNSDAHCLGAISERQNYFDLPNLSVKAVLDELIKKID